MFKKYKQMKQDAASYRQLFENRAKEVVLQRHEDDLLKFEATRSRNTVCVHNYPDGTVNFSFGGLSPKAQEALKRPVEEYFGMKIIDEKPGWFRLKKIMPRPSETRSIEEISNALIKGLNKFFESDSEDVASLTVQISQLKQAKSDLSKLTKKVTELRDFKIFEASNKQKKAKIKL